VQALYRKGQLSEQDAKDIVANGKKTSLQARFERLGMKDALSIYDPGTSKEKAGLAPSLMKKRTAFLRDMYKTHSYQKIQTKRDDSPFAHVRSATAISDYKWRLKRLAPNSARAQTASAIVELRPITFIFSV